MKKFNFKKNPMIKAVFGAVLLASSAIAAPAIWDGTADVSWYESSAQAYNLTTAEQLAGLAKLVNQGSSSFEGKTITLGADIFLNDTAGAEAGTWASIPKKEWTPIGTSSRPFKGEFDGLAGKKNRKIYGLYINNGSKNYIGLFGYTSGVRISNIDLLVGRVVGANNVGALTGYALKGSVTNVHSGIKVTGKNYVGGLIGYYTGDVSKSSVFENVVGQDSVGGLVGYTSGSISGTSSANSYFVGDVSGRKYVGGLAGYGTSISKSYVEGSVIGDSSYVGGVIGHAAGKLDSIHHTGGDVSGYAYVGGVAGYAVDTVLNSYSEGKVTGDSGYVGGLIGKADKFVKNSHSEGDVIGKRSYVGGLIGYGMSLSNSHSTGSVIGNSSYVGGVIGFATGNLISVTHTEGDVSGTSYVGGVTGANSNSSIISGSISVGNVTGKGDNVGGVAGYAVDTVWNSYSKGNVTSDGNYVGGLIGKAGKFVKNSHSEGDVIGKRSYVGGLIGYGMSLSRSYSIGSVIGDSSYVGGVIGYARGNLFSVTHTGGDVSGTSYVGGVTGYISNSSIDSSYSVGNVIGRGNNVGGLIGQSYCYYNSKSEASKTLHVAVNSQATGNVKGANNVGGVIGKDSIYISGATYTLTRNITGVYAKGLVEGSSYVGGVVGNAYNPNSSYLNINIENSYHMDGNVHGSSYVGGVVGYSNRSVQNSYSVGDVVATGSYIGGVAGYTTSSVSESHSIGDITGNGNYVGGLVGESYVAYSGSSSVTWLVVANSYSVGNIKGSNYVGGAVGLDSVYRSSSNTYGVTRNFKKIDTQGKVEGQNYVGGIIGKMDYRYYSSYSSGFSANINSVSYKGDVNGRNYVGGIAGYAYGSISNAHSESDVTGMESYVGGLLGLLKFASSSTGTVGLTNSYAVGDVKGDIYVGGLVGKDSLHKLLIKSNSNSSKMVRSVLKTYAKGNVEGKLYVGGLIGVQNRTSDTAKYVADTYIYTTIDSSYHDNGSVKGDSSYIGGLIGSTYGFVKHSHSNGDVLGFAYVGGLIGEGSKVNASHAIGSVNGGSSYVGGLVGCARGTIDSSYHKGGNVTGEKSYVGGLTGCGSVSNSYSEGNVSGLDYVGGAAGSSSKIRNSYAKATYVKGRNHVGGLSGYVTDSIKVSYFEGDSVTGVFQVGGLAGYGKSTVDSSYSTADVKGDDNVGGLIGSAYGNISNSYALGNVNGDVNNSSAGNDNLGGLVGYQYSGSVSKSMSLGNITGTTKLGGLVGRFDGTSISQSYANGNVTGNYYGDPADEVGNYYIGGLVGYAKGALNETYSSGIVKGMDEDPVYTGCMVGYVNGSLYVAKSYYDKTKCDLGIDGGEDAVTLTGVPGKTTAEMQTQSTFEDWDFMDTWKIMENTYPFLRIYSNSLTNAVVSTQSLEGIVYDGTAKTPLVNSVTLLGESLTYETEYTIAYKNNVKAGTASIEICGIKPYSGCKIIPFEIAAIAIEPIISDIENVTYTGSALTPIISVYNGKTLLYSGNYTVEYKDNVNAGTASVSVTMKGNYSGSASKTFTIKKATPVIKQNPTASNVINGQTLVSSELTGGSADVLGTFVWQAPETVPTLENDGYIAVFVPTDTMNYDSVEITVPVEVLDYVYVAVHVGDETLDSAVVIKGGNYTLPNAPDSVGYDFVGLYKGNAIVGNPGDVIVLNENTVIEAIYEAKTFAITFANGGVVLQSENTAYGTLPEYRGETPTKTATAQYTYTFKGWSPAIASVTAAATYTAVFDSTVNKYTVTFKDGATVLLSSEVAYGTVPTAPAVSLPENTAQYSYSFGGWDSEIVAVTGPATYTAVINRTLNRYGIVFKDYDGSVLKADVEYDYGTSAASIAKPANPTRGSTAQYTYTFKGWNPSIVDVTGAAVYTAEYDSTVRSYEIAFVNGNSTLQSGMVEYGQTPVYSGEAPTKTATAQHTYTFKGWNPAIASVTGTVTYEAVFDSVVNKYLITFKNDSITLQSDSVAYGTIPEYPTVTLPKNTAQYTYSMSWDKEVVAVTEDAVYTMTIDSVVNNYNVVFTDFDGTILKETSYAYGTAAASIAKPADPAREATAKYIYSFKGWSPSILDVTKDVVYKAVFDSTIRVYVITFVNGSSKLQSSEIEYGTMPSYKGDAPTKESTKEYTYLFKGWSPTIASVTGTATYTAVFDSTVRKYTVTFKNDGSVMQTISVAYGTTPVYAGSTPTRAESDSCTYTFSGWNPKLESVTSDVTYSSVFEETMKNFLVRFMNGKNILEMKMVAYGEMPEYTKNTPTKASNKTYSYEFVGWSPEIGRVTKATNFVAVFDSVKTTGIADARFANLEMSVVAASRSIQISAAPVGASYAIFDMQGRVLKQGRVDSANFNIAMPIAGNYLVKVGNRTQRVSVK